MPYQKALIAGLIWALQPTPIHREVTITIIDQSTLPPDQQDHEEPCPQCFNGAKLIKIQNYVRTWREWGDYEAVPNQYGYGPGFKPNYQRETRDDYLWAPKERYMGPNYFPKSTGRPYNYQYQQKWYGPYGDGQSEY